MELKLNKIDLLIAIPILILIAFSLGVVYSASSSWSMLISKSDDTSLLFRKHVIWVIVSVIMIFAFSRIDYIYLIKFRKALFLLGLSMLLYLLIYKIIVKGASRWIFLFGFSFQPSDFIKYALIINLAYLLAVKKEYIKSLYYSYLPMLFYVLIVVIMIALQPNISTASLIFVTCMILMFAGKVQFKHLFFTVVAVLPVGILYALSKAYALKRLTGFSEHTSGGDSDYQLSQALIGFGNGGFTGVGPGNSSQKELFLPQSYDDFIFSIVGEEYGFIGVSLVIIMFGIFIFRGIRLSQKINDDFGKYMAFGIVSIIGLQACINMMVATGTIPTTGVTLPFISYGGSSFILNSIAVGILLNISTHRQRPAGDVWKELNTDDE